MKNAKYIINMIDSILSNTLLLHFFFVVLFLWGPLISKYIISHMHIFFSVILHFPLVFIYFFSYCQMLVCCDFYLNFLFVSYIPACKVLSLCFVLWMFIIIIIILMEGSSYLREVLQLQISNKNTIVIHT